MSRFHPQVFYDAQSLVSALAPSMERLHARRILHERLREIIKSSAGDGFDVEDISMLNYAVDLDIAPLDLMIVDNKHPDGLPPHTEFRNLPDVYYPSCIAKCLQDHGFDGVIQSADIQRQDHILMNWKRSDPPPRPEDNAFRWPRYERSPKPEIVYPPVLEATTPEQFGLSLPGTTIRHTLNLLYLYGQRNSHLRLLTSLLYVWMRSWDIKEFSPATLCLLLIRFFQVLPLS
ncbi:hypothetical protein F5148DRAFT_444244 [Russula earlei]|uniref:Uncharacterized protein n=1 Tax=Russula earlei TaxID=71964 RepID=A0ACC0U0P3_9AGAM|nr:hypothetical protein F5148DRAFT_444244 [Russula earlei]